MRGDSPCPLPRCAAKAHRSGSLPWFIAKAHRSGALQRPLRCPLAARKWEQRPGRELARGGARAA